MPRTSIAPQVVTSQSFAANITFAAADSVNNMMFANDGSMILLVKNANAGACVVTVVSVPDQAGRTGDLSVTVPATTGQCFVGPLRPVWWNQTAADLGNVYLNFSISASVTVAVLDYPIT